MKEPDLLAAIPVDPDADQPSDAELVEAASAAEQILEAAREPEAETGQTAPKRARRDKRVASAEAAAALASAAIEQAAVGQVPGRQQVETKDGEVEVKVSADQLQAFILIRPPRGEGRPVTVEEANQALALAGVKYEIDQEALAKAVAEATEPSNRNSVPVQISQGRGSVNGRDASWHFCDLLQIPGGIPAERDDGGVDFFNLNIVRNVTQGTVLATKHPRTMAEPGVNVLGLPIPGVDGKDIQLKAGKGATVTEDGLEIVAAGEGHAVLAKDGSTIEVLSVFEVKTDVGTETGNIDFVGTVVIKGNINNGFTVKATQDVEVHGGIDGGSVEAGGNVTVRYGIQGAGRGTVVAGGNVTCRFMENGNVQSKGDLMVTDGILHSTVRSGGKVVTSGRKGVIIGGQIRARDSISARIVGSALATPTEVEVGTDPTLKEELAAINAKLAELDINIKKAYQAISILKDLEAHRQQEFTQMRKEQLLQALHSLRFFADDQKEALQKKKELEASMSLLVTGTVKVADMVYPGVKVIIGQDVYLVGDVIHRPSFYFSTEQGTIQVGTV
jgi:uncharacterized protein